MSAHRLEPTAKASAIAERLLAHAKLCDEIARECGSKGTAVKLQRMARDCAQTAAKIALLREAKPATRH